jgi:hypothetical protein
MGIFSSLQTPRRPLIFALSRLFAMDRPIFIAATGGLDVDAIPNEITTRIILNSSKSTILAQAINIGAKGVK